MEFSVGDLVWLVSACETGKPLGPPAVIISSYIDLPKIFLHNKKANVEWLEAEDIGVGRVYDILYQDKIEHAVLGEWLAPVNGGDEERGT